MGLTHARLLEALTYCPESGYFRWNIRTSNRAAIGSIAGSFTKGDYVRIRIDGTLHLAHRLAWFYMTGAWPVLLVDHEDTNGHNNRWDNLREASYSQNNVDKNKLPNKTGYTGVYARGPSFIAIIQFEGKARWLGSYPTAEEAHDAYEREAANLFGEFKYKANSPPNRLVANMG